MKTDPARIKILNDAPATTGTVIYWCSRDQRAADNWALHYAGELARKTKSPLCVAFCLVDDFPGANSRHYEFMLAGLTELEKNLRSKSIPFYLLVGSPAEQLPLLAKKLKAGCIVCDFSPLKIKQGWDAELAGKLGCELVEVDTHNIVPARVASSKQEYAARTLRPKIREMLDEFLTPLPPLKKHPYNADIKMPETNWQAVSQKLLSKLEKLPAIDWLTPGEKAARKILGNFIAKKLENYDTDRNNPNIDGLSNLSPYLHFGQISAQRVALEVKNSAASQQAKNVFLEELIVRRELSDNFCLHNKNYDNFDGLPDWAKKTLTQHKADKRPYLYSFEQLEKAQTHSPAWNAAQLQMVHFGKMHGYMRMYWAKKILQWTKNPQTAIEWAIKLNDRYQLDGRDPNGFVGVLWSIGGLHDRPWQTRDIFGSVRYMNTKGLRRKFDLDKYIDDIYTATGHPRP